MSRFQLSILIALCAALAAKGADTDSIADTRNYPSVSVKTDIRFDFNYRDIEDDDSSSGFYGKYLNLIVDADITNDISMHYRQRLNKFGEMRSDLFGATDWVYLDYSPSEMMTLSGGKQVVAIGGYEYDRNPVDVFFSSMFWQNIGCYQFGVSATLHSPDKANNITFQISNSPYSELGNSCFAYNVMWIGNVSCFKSLWSANLIEYSADKYGGIISLGNRFSFNRWYAEIDLMNRYLGCGHFMFDDYSAIAKICASIDKFDIFAKGGYEKYRPSPGISHTYDKPFAGLGVEYYPLGNRNLRLHLVGDITHEYSTGRQIAEISTGLTWRVNLYNK